MMVAGREGGLSGRGDGVVEEGADFGRFYEHAALQSGLELRTVLRG